MARALRDRSLWQGLPSSEEGRRSAAFPPLPRASSATAVSIILRRPAAAFLALSLRYDSGSTNLFQTRSSGV